MSQKLEESWKKTFYNSNAWKKVRANVLERDFNMCQFCGILIVENSPHAHHLIELDSKNYTDPNISLNEKMVVTLCRNCHDKIHDRFQLKDSFVNFLFEIDYANRITQLKKNAKELKFEITQLEKENKKLLLEINESKKRNKTIIKKVLENTMKINQNKNKLKK